MKKYIIALILVVSIAGLSYASNVLITAKVWSLNSRPIVITLNPANDPKLLQRWKTQAYELYFQDIEKDEVTYSITPSFWTTNILNGTISIDDTNTANDYDSNSWAYLNFTYFAPNFSTSSEKIIVTLNDNKNVTTYQINLRIY